MTNDFSWVDEFWCGDRIVHRDRSGTFINTEWRAFEAGRSRTRTDIDPVPSLHDSCVYPSPSSLSSIAKAPGGKMWEWIDCGEHMQSITCGGTGPHPKNQHPSLRCLWYQFSIMVKLKLSRFPLKQFASLVVWLFCVLSENILDFCIA